MTLPPPPDPYGSQPPQGGGQPGGGVPPQWGSQQGGVPPQGFGGYGPPPQGQWGPQQQWPGGPGGQPPKSGKGKWILGGIAVVLAIALAVVITVLVVRPADGGGGNGDPTQQNGDSEFASADDTGPVNIITEDPTCAAWSRISREYSAMTEGANWKNRAKNIPASSWTPEQRVVYETVSSGMAKAADEVEGLAKQTPHRIMRELFMQFSAYSGEFISAIPNYQPSDENNAAIANTLVSVISNVCSAIQFGSAQSVSSLVPSVSPSRDIATFDGASSAPVPFVEASAPECEEWMKAAADYNRDTAMWQATDPSIPVDRWTPEQKAVMDEVGPVMSSAAERFQTIGQSADSDVFQDFALVTAQYMRAYVASLPAYAAGDNYLIRAGNYLGGVLDAACKGSS